MKRIVSLILSICTLFSISACAMFPLGNNSNSSDYQSDSSDGLNYTGYKLVDDGKSEYKIVLPNEPSEAEETASWELEALFAEATSITLETVYESEITYSDTAKLILLGNTQYAEIADVDVDAIPYDGFTLKTVGSNLFVLGKEKGVLYGVYEFLENTFGFEYFVSNVYALDKNVKNQYMPKLDISDAPDIAYRTDAWGAEKGGIDRARLRSFTSPFMSYGMYQVHNTMDWLPPATYKATHSSWYASSGGQLCYTAHGNETELAAMQEVVLEKFKEQVNHYFGQGEYLRVISFTQNEGTTGGWCNCSACVADKQTYGAASASIIRFLNPVAKQFKEWLEATYPGHEVTIVFFAYQYSESAPVKTEGEKIVPADESVVLEDNLAVWLAPIYGDFTRSITDVKNTTMYQSFKNWSVLSKQLYVWGYDTNYSNYLMWYDTFEALPDFYKYLKEFNVQYMFNQGQIHSNSNLTGFDAFKIALNSKLMWDCDMDVEAFTDRFFETWFGGAAQDMRKYYDSFISWSKELKTEQNYDGDLYFDGYTTSHYPLNKLNEWQGYIEDAYESIESLKESKPNRYNNLYKRINAESIAVRYAMLRIHSMSFTQDELWEMVTLFKKDATELGFIQLNEWSKMDSLYNSWGL